MQNTYQPEFIPFREGVLYTVRHEPTGEARCNVLMLAPLFEEKKSSYRALRDLAVCLSANGCRVLRFDYFGTGDSTGDFSFVTMGSLRESITCALASLQAEPVQATPVQGTPVQGTSQRPLILLGLRVGADLALDMAQETNAASVIALAPVLKGARFLKETVRKKQVRAMLTGHEAVTAAGDVSNARATGQIADIDGFATQSKFLDELETFEPASEPGTLKGSLLVDIGPVDKPGQTLAQFAQTTGAEAAALRCDTFWNLTDAVNVPELEDCVLLHLKKWLETIEE